MRKSGRQSSVERVAHPTRRAEAPGGEKLYVIEDFNYRGTLIYTKGKIAREAGEEIYYFFVSSKLARYGP